MSTGALLLTYTLSIPDISPLVPGNEGEAEKQNKFKEIAKGAVNKSIETTLEMLAEGQLN
jgi:hypothetical protein